jgi:hypothetical protein
MKKGIIIIHGMGEKEKDYSLDFQELFTEECVSNGIQKSDLIFKEVEWSSILKDKEEVLFNNIKQNLSFLGLRKFIIHSFGDAIAYQKTENNNDTYHKINDLLMEKYNELIKTLNNDNEIYFVAHSLGGVILSNFIYDYQNFTNKIKFKKLFTFGTTIPLWTLKYQNLDSPIKIEQGQKWINMYDSDDVLGYPLGNISPAYKRLVRDKLLIDIEVNSGNFLTSWNPLSHLGYWKDSDVIEIIADNMK